MAGRFKELFSKKRNQIIVLATLIGVIIAGVSLYFTPQLFAQTIEKPKLTVYPAESTNQEIIFEAEKPFAVKLNNKEYFSPANSPYSLNLGKISGENLYQVHSFMDMGFSRVLSKEKQSFKINGDYLGPEIKFTSLKKYYTERNIFFAFETSEKDFKLVDEEKELFNSQRDFNFCLGEVVQEVSKIVCPITFPENDELVLNYSIFDKLGNQTEVFNGSKIRYVLPPKLDCLSAVSITNKNSLVASCTANKPGLLKVSNGQEMVFENAQSVDLTLPLNEGGNDFNFLFTDKEELEASSQLSAVKDTQKPTIDFTFVDSKKKFLEGNYTVGLKTSEDAKVTVNIQPYNDYLERTPNAKARGGFDYSGGASQTRDVTGGGDERFSVKNNMGSCQVIEENKNGDTVYLSDEEYLRITNDTSLLSKWFAANPGKTLGFKSPKRITATYFKFKKGYCNFYNSRFIRSTINVVDKAGNANTYYCTGLIYDDKISIKGDGKTRCSQNINEIGCEWFYNLFGA